MFCASRRSGKKLFFLSFLTCLLLRRTYFMQLTISKPFVRIILVRLCNPYVRIFCIFFSLLAFDISFNNPFPLPKLLSVDYEYVKLARLLIECGFYFPQRGTFGVKWVNPLGVLVVGTSSKVPNTKESSYCFFTQEV